MQHSERSELRDPTERSVAELTDISASLNSAHEYMAEKGEQRKTLEKGRKAEGTTALTVQKGLAPLSNASAP